MTPRPLVSVVIPTYRHRDFVAEALRSVAAQTMRDLEVIVVNDGSPDDTEAVLAPWIAAGTIRYVKQENAGQAAARNRGIELAQGEFVALLDDDDLWPPDKLAWQVEFLRAHPRHGMIAGTAQVVDAALTSPGRTAAAGDVSIERLFEGNVLISPGQALIRAETLRAVGGFRPEIWGADDWDLYFRIVETAGVRVEERVALVYRKHEGNASADMARMLANCCRVVRSHIGRVGADRRGRVRRGAYRYLYRYAGTRLRAKAAASLRSGRVFASGGHMAGFAPLVPAMAADPVLAWWFLKDFFPQSLRSTVRGE
jgi:glycosyltransferase involved in cell wall biosynthesis